MADYEAISENLDGLGLIKLLQKVYFKKDDIKQIMVEIVKAGKRLSFCWQKMGIIIDQYMNIR